MIYIVTIKPNSEGKLVDGPSRRGVISYLRLQHILVDTFNWIV